MSPYLMYQMVQAEQAAQRARCSAAQYSAAQRQADAQLGELAATMARWIHGLGIQGLGIHRLGIHRLAREKP